MTEPQEYPGKGRESNLITYWHSIATELCTPPPKAKSKDQCRAGGRCMIHGDVMSTHARSTMLRALIHNVNGT